MFKILDKTMATLRRIIIGVMIGSLLIACGVRGYTVVRQQTQPVIMYAPPAMMLGGSEEAMVDPFGNILNTMLTWSLFTLEIGQHYNVVVIWNGPGGWTMVEKQVEYDIEQLKGKTNIKFIVTEYAASAQAMALCEFDNVEVSPYATLIYHLEMNAATKELTRDKSEYDTCKEKGFLTEEDIHQLVDLDMEVWITFQNGERKVTYKPDSRFPPEEQLVPDQHITLPI